MMSPYSSPTPSGAADASHTGSRDAPQRIGMADLRRLTGEGTPIVMLTAYDFPSARVATAAGVDVVLVGDSAANVVLGYRSTREISLDELLMLTQAARRGLEDPDTGAKRLPMLVGDLPYGSYEDSDARAAATALRFAREAGCDAVKLEGGGAMVQRAKAIIAAGVPVMGHVGLLPQSVASGGEWTVQGRTAAAGLAIVQEALALQAAGCMALVLEAVPAPLTELLVPLLHIPAIGIGAGAATHGQVLVFHDVMGLSAGRSPRFVKRYAASYEVMTSAARAFAEDVRARRYPAAEHSYGMDAGEVEGLRRALETLARS